MSVTALIPPHANVDPLTLRQIWMPSSYVDSYQRDITFNKYGGKLSYHEFDSERVAQG